jgi:peptide chain release factor
MLFSISSGNGVDEVCRALWHFLEWLKKKAYRFEVVKLEYAACNDGYKSIIIESEDERILALEGTHLWRSQSPFRPGHKRKSWYFTLHSIVQEDQADIDLSKVVYQIMKSPKKGGQHVNTTCSGVRALYPPLGLEAISYDERSQHRNKATALRRLLDKAKEHQATRQKSTQRKQWCKSKTVARGNAVKVFEGEAFREVVSS